MRGQKLAVAILLLSIVLVGPTQAFANEVDHPKYFESPIISYDWLIGEELFNHVYGEFDMGFTPTEAGEQDRLHNYY